MNKETIKPESPEDGVDLYDGMIFAAKDANSDYISGLDYYTLHILKDRLKEYYEIMNDDDYTKGEKLSERLGRFIDKHTLKSMLNHVVFLLSKENKDIDNFDAAIINFMNDPEVLEGVGYEELLVLRQRVMMYYTILKSDREDLKEKLFERIGHNLATDSVKELLDYVDGLIEERFEQG